jgi:hypothetical protein
VRFRAGEALTRMGAKGLEMLKKIAAGGEGLARDTARLTLAERKLL